MVPIGDRALAWIQRYLVDARPRLVAEPDDGTLFLTVDGTPFSPDRLTQIVRDYVKASGGRRTVPVTCSGTPWPR